MMYYFLAFLAAILTGVAQILLKKGAQKYGENSFLRQFLNIFVISGYTIFVIVSVLNLIAYKEIDLKNAAIFIPLSYFTVVIMSKVWIKEKTCIREVMGISLVIIGLGVFFI